MRARFAPTVGVMLAAAALAASARAEDARQAAFAAGSGRVQFWQTNRLAGGQGTCILRFGFQGSGLSQPIEKLTLVIRIVDRNGADLGTGNLVLDEPLGGSNAARYREGTFEGVTRWPLQDDGAPSPLCDDDTALIVESAAGRQAGKIVDLVRFGQLRFTAFPRIRVKVGE
jgi:hypothetical protein